MQNNTGNDLNKLFRSSVLGALKTCGKISTDCNDTEHDICLVAYAEWGGDKKFESFPDVVSATLDFTTWAKDWKGYQPEPAVVPGDITLSVDIPFGKSMIHFTVNGTPHELTPDGYGKAYIELYDLMQGAYQRFWAARGRKSEPTPNDTQGNGGDFDNFSFDRVVVNVNNGKRSIRVFGGKWQSFGVVAWPEVFQGTGIDPDKLPVGESKITGEASALMVNGKPKKVTRIKVA